MSIAVAPMPRLSPSRRVTGGTQLRPTNVTASASPLSPPFGRPCPAAPLVVVRWFEGRRGRKGGGGSRGTPPTASPLHPIDSSGGMGLLSLTS